MRQFAIFLDPYYWRTAVLIAKSGLTRQYRNSYLGILWTLFQPLSMVIVYSVIMPMIMRMPHSDYTLYIICTLPLWGFISSSMIGASASLLAQGETLKRCMISSTIFPIADVFRNVYTYFIAFLTMLGFVTLLGAPVSLHVLLWPIYFLPVLGAVMGMAIGIAFTAPYVRDIGEAIMVAMNMLFWFSAIVYPVAAVPEWVQAILQWNPIVILMQPAVELVYHHTLPTLAMLLKSCAVSVVAMMIGYGCYHIGRRNFVYYL